MLRHLILSTSISASLLGLALAPLAAAHGEGHHDTPTTDMNLADSGKIAAQEGNVGHPHWPESYWNHEEHSKMLVVHILLMLLAWVVVLPLGVMFGVARSRLALPTQFAFLTINAVGVSIGAIYNGQTPDLYMNNSHHKLGWIASWTAGVWVLLSLVNAYTAKRKHDALGQASHPMSAAAMAQYQRVELAQSTDAERWSHDSGQGTERNSASLFSHSRSPSEQSENLQLPSRYHYEDSEDGDEMDEDEKQGFLRGNTVDRFMARHIGKLAVYKRGLQALNVVRVVLERTILILGFVALCTGIIIAGGIARGDHKFNILAHFIKGGIFLWYGFLTLGRWMGCFAELGWAWNANPPQELVGRRAGAAPSAEFVESFLIFLYGSSNVFLEHLAAWGGAWTASDLEHVSISVMFFGGGLLGMLIESKRIRTFLNTNILRAQQSHAPDAGWSAPSHYRVSLNPIPALVIMLLGIMMSSHHQDSMLSTMVHKQWGTMFVAASFARAVTYIILYLSPPTSYLPSRPPSELVTAFCLIAGGTTFMISNKDTIDAMDDLGMDAMFTFTLTMGLTCLLMAWQVIVTAIKGWAVSREQRPEDVAVLRMQMGDSMPA